MAQYVREMSTFIEDEQINQFVNALPKCVICVKTLKLLFKKQYKQRTEDWYAKRRSSLTASDCAAVLGLNKYQSRSKVLEKKIRPDEKKGEDNKNSFGDAACQHGIKYEDEAADVYMCRNPHLAPFFEVGLIMHEKHPFIGASPDRVTKDGILIEIKVR